MEETAKPGIDAGAERAAGQAPRKDRWDKFHILAQASIPLMGGLFTLVFHMQEQRSAGASLQLAEANQQLSRTQVQVALLPFLSSQDPKQRTLGLLLAPALDERFASDVASILAIDDPDNVVQGRAVSTLQVLRNSTRQDIKQDSQAALERAVVVTELRKRQLVQSLREAAEYVDGGSANAVEEAWRIYQDVLKQLPDSVTGLLAQPILAEAQRQAPSSKELAVRSYRSLFDPYIR